MNFKERFNLKINGFIEAGLVNELYSSDELGVCNLANLGYFVLLYRSVDFAYPVGYYFAKSDIIKIIEDNSNIYKFFKGMDKQTKEKRLFVFSNDMIDKLKKVKSKTDLDGPYPVIDFEWEEMVRQMH